MVDKILEAIQEMTSGVTKGQAQIDLSAELDDVCLGSALIKGETSGIFEGDPFESVSEDLDEDRPYKLPGEPGYTNCFSFSPGLCGGCDECLRQQSDYYSQKFPYGAK